MKIKSAIIQHGSVATGVACTTQEFKDFQGEYIPHCEAGKPIDHAVLIVGWGK